MLECLGTPGPASEADPWEMGGAGTPRRSHHRTSFAAAGRRRTHLHRHMRPFVAGVAVVAADLTTCRYVCLVEALDRLGDGHPDGHPRLQRTAFRLAP